MRTLLCQSMPQLAFAPGLPPGQVPGQAHNAHEQAAATKHFIETWWGLQTDADNETNVQLTAGALVGFCHVYGLVAHVIGQGNERSQASRMGRFLGTLATREATFEVNEYTLKVARYDGGNSHLYQLEVQ